MRYVTSAEMYYNKVIDINQWRDKVPKQSENYAHDAILEKAYKVARKIVRKKLANRRYPVGSTSADCQGVESR